MNKPFFKHYSATGTVNRKYKPEVKRIKPDDHYVIKHWHHDTEEFVKIYGPFSESKVYDLFELLVRGFLKVHQGEIRVSEHTSDEFEYFTTDGSAEGKISIHHCSLISEKELTHPAYLFKWSN